MQPELTCSPICPVNIPRILRVILPRLTLTQWAVMFATAAAGAAALDEFIRWAGRG